MRHLFLIALFCPGCFWVTTKYEGDQLKRQVKELQTTVGSQQQAVDDKVKELDDSIAKATKVLSTNSADIGSQVQSISDDVAKLTGENEDLKRQLTQVQAAADAQKKIDDDKIAQLIAEIDTLNRAAGVINVASPTTAPVMMTPKQLYADAQRNFAAKNYPEARRELQLWLENNPHDPDAEAAQLGLAEAFYYDHQPDKAIAEYSRLISTYPNGQLVADAYMEAGQAELDQKHCADARAFYSELVRNIPSSPKASKAQSKLDVIRKSMRDRSICAQ